MKDVLFALYGEDAFKQLHVTACGNKVGSYGIKQNVLNAVLGKQLTFLENVNKKEHSSLFCLIFRFHQSQRDRPEEMVARGPCADNQQTRTELAPTWK